MKTIIIPISLAPISTPKVIPLWPFTSTFKVGHGATFRRLLASMASPQRLNGEPSDRPGPKEWRDP